MYVNSSCRMYATDVRQQQLSYVRNRCTSTAVINVLCSFQAHIHLMLRKGIFFWISRHSGLWTSKLLYLSRYYSSCWLDEFDVPRLFYFSAWIRVNELVFWNAESYKIVESSAYTFWYLPSKQFSDM